ncbi:2'-5' RNA ligase [Planomonospora parontospora subsp. parontospora]|uniref:2'-5' RNA ligase n=2 Tax=Planomonospora parontospora TaxID=58119 RepID=A0AA37BPC6_9ACTN|nr:2'-5' RNA ligase family protein [Planomonospora parontospora]GGL00198.1 2'-5' RNA ligase [Planomonospora parontospora]GII13086.1 2'-5' RNA ligase [Planomonospora parontospora subsp. parontospora]
MVAALELYLDPAAEKRIRTLWRALAQAGVQSMGELLKGRHRPHVSLLSAAELDGPGVAAALAGMDAAPPLELRFDFVGQFLGRVLWLGPVPTAELLAHHAAVHGRLDAVGIGGFDVYRPGGWVPHCTLSMRVPHAVLPGAIRLCMDFLPIRATVTGAAVADHARDLFTPL